MIHSMLLRSVAAGFGALTLFLGVLVFAPNEAGVAGASGTPFTVFFDTGLSTTGTEQANSQIAVIQTKAAVNALNKEGGIDGHHISLDIVNDAGDPGTAETDLQSYLATNHPDLYMNGGPSNISAAVLPTLTQDKVLSMNSGDTGTSGNSKQFPYNFDVEPLQNTYAIAAAAYAKKQNYHSAAIMYANDSFTAPEEQYYDQDLQKDGIKVTGVESVDPTALDVTPQEAKLKSGNPDVLFFLGFGPIAGYALQDAANAGFANTPILGDIASSDTPVLSQAPPSGLLGSTVEKHFLYQVAASTVKRPANETPANTTTMLKNFDKVGQPQVSISTNANYDSLMLVAAAAKEAGTITNVPKLVNAITHLKPGQAATGLSPYYTFTSSNHTTVLPASAYIYIKPAPVSGGLFTPTS